MALPGIESNQRPIRAKCDRCGLVVECLSNPFGDSGYVGLCSRRDKPWKRCGGKLVPMKLPPVAVLRSIKAMTPSEQDEADLEAMLTKAASQIGRED